MVASFNPEEFGFRLDQFLEGDERSKNEYRLWTMMATDEDLIGWILTRRSDSIYELVQMMGDFRSEVIYVGPIESYCDAMDIFEEHEVY